MRRLTMTFGLILAVAMAGAPGQRHAEKTWLLGPFVRDDRVNPILEPRPQSRFQCPVRKEPVAWEHDHVFNPAAAVRNGKVYVLYRAEDDSGEGIGHHTSRIGLAESTDGHRFTRRSTPVLFPTNASTKKYDWPGGCEDPRIVATPTGYLMTYTSWDRKTARLSAATSRDLVTWVKHGPVFAKASGGRFLNDWSKSGSVVCRLQGDQLVAAKIKGKYWMYWGEGKIKIATSANLVDWQPLVDKNGQYRSVFGTRPGRFDSEIAEPGPPAVLTSRGIVFIYNGKNAAKGGDPKLKAGVYAAGQALLDANDPTRLLDRTESYFFKPERPYEVTGQYASGTVFLEGLVRFKGKWLLYYGTADSKVAMASTR